MYQAIGGDEHAEPKLRSYALCDWGELLCRGERIRQADAEEKAVQVLTSSLDMGVPADAKLAMNWVHLGQMYSAKAKWERALHYLEQARGFFAEYSDFSGLLAVLDFERGVYIRQGNLRKAFELEQEMRKIYTASGEPTYLRTRISVTWERLWAGHYAVYEKEFRATIEIAKSLQDQDYLSRATRDLALCLAFQGKCTEALAMAEEGLSQARNRGREGEMYEVFLALLLYGIVCMKCGKMDGAEEHLTEAITVGQKLHAHLDATPLYLATVYEVLQSFEKAEYFYQLSQTNAHRLGRNYFECAALIGLVRVKRAQSDYAALPPLWTDAERLAQQYEYNDNLTSLYLTRGQIIWEGHIPDWGAGFDSALHYYQYALIHALRYNRFLLDETLSGRSQDTSLQSIIPHSLKYGKEGRQMLTALREWWQNGMNDVGISRPDTLSPLPENILLQEAERVARRLEPGDGSLQVSVVEQIKTALEPLE